MSIQIPETSVFITRDALLDHWLGHRRLTRKLLEVYPEEQLFEFSIGGMRTFGGLIQELLGMAAPMAQGLATDDWEMYGEKPDTKAGLLKAWDESTAEIEEFWPKISAGRFQQTFTSFGEYQGPGHWQLLYVIDNEIHHRGQGYVYLRALGVEPPMFWER